MSTPQRDEIDWVPVYNTTAETIPSGALARVTGVTDGVFQLAKPNADSDTTVIVVGRHAIPADRYGRGTFDPRVIAAYDYADGTPAAGDQMGSANGSWYLNSGKAGFYVLGGAGNGLVNAVREAGSGTASPLTTKGDVWGYSTTDARIPVGADGQVLTADSAQALGLKWATPTTGTVTSIVTKESDGAPSYTFTSTVSMEFDQATGHKLTQPGAGRVKMEMLPASTTQTGVVNTAAQSFDGNKTFEADLYTTDGSTVLNVNNIEGNVVPLVVYSGGYVNGGADPAPAIKVTGDTLTNYADTSDRQVCLFGLDASSNGYPGELRIDGVIKLLAIADADAPNGSLYNSSTSGKLSWKDSGGTVNSLY